MVKPENANKDNAHLHKELRMQGHLSMEKSAKKERTNLTMSSQKSERAFIPMASSCSPALSVQKCRRQQTKPS